MKDINAIGSVNANKIFDQPLQLNAGQVNTLAFSQDSIRTMQLTAKGELEISFRDGSKVTIENFNELADSAKSCGRDTLIQLSDNTIIYPDQLRDQLVQQGGLDMVAENTGAIMLDEPKAGQILTKNIEAGQEYKLGFTLDGVNAAQSGHNLLLTFKDGGVLVLNNYFTAVNGDLPPAMTLANGATIDANALLTSCKLVEVPNAAEAVLASAPPQSELRQSVPNIEPAAGEEAPAVKAKDVANIAPAAGENVANIEPAAGEGPTALSGSARGYGFGSSIDGAGFNGQSSIGAIGATALNYGAPSVGTIPYVAGVPFDPQPSLGLADGIVDETSIGSVTGNVPVNYGGDGPGALTLNNSFTSDYALTSHGVPVVVSLVNGVYTGTANGQTVFTLNLDPTTGNYTFTQLAQLDHTDASNPNDSIGLVFGVTATDRDGDIGTTSITIRVLDDGPVAVDDGAFVGNNSLTVTGNVLTNDDAGTDGLGRVTNVSFNGQNYAVPATGTTSVVGAYGTLVIDAAGKYTYTSSNTALGTDVFTYTMVDYDGDSSTAKLSVGVRDLDTTPIVANGENMLDETNVAPDGTESVSGKVVVDFKADGPGVVDATGAFSSGGSQKNGALTSNGVPVTVAMVGDVYTGTANGKVVFTLKINDDGTYVYTQVGQLDHADGSNPNDVIELNFGFIAKDSDGDTANGTIKIKVLDDAPVARDDVATLASAPGSVSGNVLTNDTMGQDKPGYAVKSVTFEGNTVNVPTTGTVTIAGLNGNLTIGANGAYTYTGSKVGSDVFTYTIVDQDGDVSTAKLTVTTNDLDTTPIVANGENMLDETNVAPDGTESVSGKVVVDFKADGPGVVDATGAFSSGGSQKNGALTSNGVPVTVSMAGDVYTGTANGKVVFTLKINDDGSYTYTQVGQLDHADGTNPNDVIELNFGFVAKDSDGDTANGTIKIKVLDDAPVAVNDGFSHVTQPVSGNVLSNDYKGTDSPVTVTKVLFNGVDYAVSATGTTTIVGDHGTLVIKADGNYTYTPINGSGMDNFVYAIRDYDGDISSAHLAFDVKGDVTVDLVLNGDVGNVCVKEDSSIVIPVTANVNGGDGNEVLTLTLTGVASNWGFSAPGWTKTGDGTYSITLPVGQTNYSGGFTFAPPANSDVDLNGLKLTASVYDPDLASTKTSVDNLNIFVDAVADVPVLNVTIPSYNNHDPSHWTFSSFYNYIFFGDRLYSSPDFTINGSVTDQDGSEVISHYTVKLPDVLSEFGVKFSAGHETSPGLWQFTPEEVVGLKITFPSLVMGPNGWSSTPGYYTPQGIHNFVVTAYSVEKNLSGMDCDLTNNTNSVVSNVQVVIFSSPLVIDLNNDGLNLTDADHGVMFDINGDGIKDKTGWVAQDDGLLALDKNGNGNIDGQSELFGGNTVDGFTILAAYDDNKDGVIDSKDAVWKDLKVWQDLNQDGLSQSGELLSMDDLDFSSISLDAKAVDYMIAGNGISAESSMTNKDGSETLIADAWFAFYNGADAEQMAAAGISKVDPINSDSDIRHAYDPLPPVISTVDVGSISNVPQMVETPSKGFEILDPIIIQHFDVAEDKLDLSALLDDGACAVTTAIQDFVFSRTENGNTIISLDKTGSGSASAAVDVVVLKDIVINHLDDIVQITQQQQAQSGLGTV